MVLACALFVLLIDFFLLFSFPFLGPDPGWKIELPAYFFLFLGLIPPLYFGWSAEKNRERLEQLADRLRRLYKGTGRPALRVRRPRRLHFETHQALRELEKSLRTLELHYQIWDRRLRYPRVLIDDLKPILDSMSQRIARLEEVAGK